MIAAAALAIGAVLSPVADQGPDAEVVAVVYRFFDAMRAKDTVALRHTLHEQARLVSAGRDRAGNATVRVDSIAVFLRSIGSATRRLDEKIWDPEVRVDGDLATVWTPYVFLVDGALSHCGVDAFQLARTPAGWKIIQIADTRRREGCPEPPAHAR